MERVVIPRLEAVSGVGKVTVWGVLRDSVRILLDEDKVAAAQMDIGEVIRRLMQDNFVMPLGEIDDGGNEIILRSDMRFRTPEEIAEYPIGGGLKIKDVGRVSRVKSVGDSLSFIDGGVAYYGMASKDSQSNVVEVSRNWEATLKNLESDPALHGRMSSMTFFLQGDMIESALGQLRQTAIWGGALAVLVLFVFLRRVRLTLCVALSIPVSALLAIAWEFFGGGTFNVLTMTGITLGIGMLVDNSVVVVENIARLHKQGRSATEAAVVGTRQIGMAVTLATLTTVVVFLPLIFMSSNPMVRLMFGGIGIPLSVSLLASLLVAVIFLPVITARLLGDRPRAAGRVAGRLSPVVVLPVRIAAWSIGAVRALWYGLVRVLHMGNRAALAVLSPLRWVLAAGVVALCAWKWRSLSGLFQIGDSLKPFGTLLGGGEAQASRMRVALILAALVGIGGLLLGARRWHGRPSRPPARPVRFVPTGSSLIGMIVEANWSLVSWTLSHRLLAFAFSLLAYATILVPQSQMVTTPFGEDSSTDSVEFNVQFNANFSLEEAGRETERYDDYIEAHKEEYGFDHWSNRYDESGANFALYWDARKNHAFFDGIQEDLSKNLPRIPGHTLTFYDQERTSNRSASVATFALRGPDSSELERLGAEAARILETVPGLSQVSSRLRNAPEQIDVKVDRDRARQLGVNTDAIQQTIAWTLRGFPLPAFQEKGRQVPLLIEYDEEKTAGLATLRDLSVFGEQGMVPLSSVAELASTKGSRSIYRRDGQTSFTLTAKVDDPTQIIPITERGYRALGELDMPRGYGFDRQDSAGSRQEAEFAELQNAFLLSIVLVFLLMGILFESLLLPFSVLFTIPFAIMGAKWTLFLTGTPMDSMGYIGMIILAGVVVNNGIVLIDRVHCLRREGLARTEAIVTGCGQRVRPVLMTALTTVCGLFPMILTEPAGGGNGIDYRALATIVAGGLVASTFFTLWVVPLVYSLLDDLATVMRGRFRTWSHSPRAGHRGVRPAA